MPRKLVDEMLKYDVQVFPGYGLTEAANLSTGNMDPVRKPGSVGRLFPEQSYRIVDGELWLKGDNVMLGYYNDPEETALVMEDDWLKTGDLVDIDEEGFLTIVGRIKNMIVLGNGENVYPEELEAKINADARVTDCMVKEMHIGDSTLLGVEIFPNKAAFGEASNEEIEQQLTEWVESVNEKLMSYQKLMHVVIRDTDFARTGALKIDRKKHND